MSSRRKYRDLSATIGDDGWTAWIWPVPDGYRFRCCDCELVHVLQFRVDDGDIGMRVVSATIERLRLLGVSGW